MDQSPAAAFPVLLAGRYRLAELLGRGGMADVHAAVVSATGVGVAVKLFRQPLPGVEECGVEDSGVRDGEVPRWPGCAIPGWWSCWTSVTTRAARSA